MAYSVLQGTGATGSATTISAIYGSNLSAGTKLFALVIGNQVDPTAVSDGTNSFVKLIDFSLAIGGGAFDYTQIWVLDTPSGDVGTKPTITATVNNTNGCALVIAEVSGLAAGTTTAILDGTQGTNNANVPAANTSTTTSAPAYSSTASGEMLLYAYYNDGDNGNNTTGGNPTGYTNLTTGGFNSSGAEIGFAYKNSTGGAESGGSNWTTSSPGSSGWSWGQIMVAFKLAAGGAAGPGGPPVPQQRSLYAPRWTRRQAPQQAFPVPPAVPGAPGAGGAVTPQQPKQYQPRWLLRQQPWPGLPGPVISASLADAAAAEDTDANAFLVSAAIPEADAAAAVDAISITVAVPLADAGAAEDTDASAFQATAAVPLAEAAAAEDTDPSAFITGFTEQGTGPRPQQALTYGPRWRRRQQPWADSAPAVSVSLADTAAAEDTDPAAFTAAASVPLADVAAAADASALQVSAAVPVTDVAAAEDTDANALAASAAVPLPDVAAAEDTDPNALLIISTLTPGAPATPQQSRQFGPRWMLRQQPWPGAASSAANLLPDVAGAAEAISITATAALADVAAGEDTDPAAFTVSAAVPVTDVAGAAEVAVAGAVVPLGDAGAAADSVVPAAAVPLSDVSAAEDTDPSAFLASAAVALADAGGAAETVGIPAETVSLTDVAGSAELISVVKPFTGPAAAWAADQLPPRWQVLPAGPRWVPAVVPSRWSLLPALSRWSLSPAQSRWRITMAAFPPIAALSPEYVNVLWTSVLDGTVIDPTGNTPGQPLLVVKHAFPVSSGNQAAPAQPVTWYTAQWLAGGTGKGWVAQCPVGPGQGTIVLTPGVSYDVWSQVFATGESPMKFAGTLAAY